MRILGIKINNYKSFSNKNNVLRFDFENTLGLIGKNESGKSNTLLALKELLFFDSSLNPSIFNDYNRLTNEPVDVSLEVEFDENDFDFEKYGIKNSKAIITFRKDNNSVYMDFDGCLSEILKNDLELFELVEEIKKIGVKNYSDKNCEIFKNKISNYDTTFIKVDSGNSFLSMNSSQQEAYNQFKDKIKKYYEMFNQTLPKIIYFSNDMILKNRYTYDNIVKKEDINGLNLLLGALDFSIEDLKDWLLTSDGAKKQKYFTMFKYKLDEFNKDFQSHYKTNKIELLFNVDSKIIEFSVRDDLLKNGTSITNFSERSDGLKWYLSLFIKLYATKKTYKNSLILLDEPGNSLHVLAQRELLNLLLKTDNYQIIYTTHSPYMIDINHLENIRLISKNDFSIITNGINNSKKTGKTSYKETITPICEAIGLSINYNFGPSSEKINLVVEGITDYYYLSSFMDYLKLKEEFRPNIIPCIGVTNESNIVSILTGWGYDYKCLFDNDKDGVAVFNEIKKSVVNFEDKLFFVNETYGNTIESLLSKNVKKNIDVGSKTLNAKKFAILINKDDSFLDEETILNFENLFIKIGIGEFGGSDK